MSVAVRTTGVSCREPRRTAFILMEAYMPLSEPFSFHAVANEHVTYAVQTIEDTPADFPLAFDQDGFFGKIITITPQVDGLEFPRTAFVGPVTDDIRFRAYPAQLT